MIDIDKKIDFKMFLHQAIKDEEAFCRLIEIISSKTNIYVFSGIIRNYFLDIPSCRDLDFVIEDNTKVDIFKEATDLGLKVGVNSYNGMKILLKTFSVDIWTLKDTYTIKKRKLKPNPQTLIKTSFFNFQSIVFDYNKEEFIYGKEFENFYNNRIMTVVNEDNPNIPLCIANTIHYADKYSFGIDYNLCKWIVDHYSDKYHYRGVQLHHFEEIKYNDETIKKFYDKCFEFIMNNSNKTNKALTI